MPSPASMAMAQMAQDPATQDMMNQDQGEGENPFLKNPQTADPSGEKIILSRDLLPNAKEGETVFISGKITSAGSKVEIVPDKVEVQKEEGNQEQEQKQ